ncbi:hypothetical protein JTB14_013565 [Gonioctena quinquepunctata]|nr:hypothetical protein JTB14_013565 [Gonioctena quinquepunctata]
MVYEDDIDVREIFIEPPDSNVLTDEDSGEEDEGGTIDNLNRQQLSAHVEVRIHNGEENNQIEAAASTTQNIAERPVVNAWNIYRQQENIKQLVFRTQIVQTYLTKYAVPPKGAGKPATSRSSVSLNRVSDDLRYDGRNHLCRMKEGKEKMRR